MIPHSQRMIDHTRLFIEHCKISVEDGRVIYLNHNDGATHALAYRNTPFLLLGPGTSITQAAARLLASERVPFGFCGGQESPLFTSEEIVWQLSSDEYGPSEYMQQWAKLWFDEARRLAAAKHFFIKRLQMSRRVWSEEMHINPKKLITPDIETKLAACSTTNEVLTLEARLTKATYAEFAKMRELGEFSRVRGIESTATKMDLVNKLLDSGNYLAYGFAASALAGIGIPHGFPVMHGKTRRGGLVFDVADLVKDAIVLPEAFKLGSQGAGNRDTKKVICDHAKNYDVITFMIDTIKECLSIDSIESTDSQSQ